MFDKHRTNQWHSYLEAHKCFSENPESLIELEKWIMKEICSGIQNDYAELKANYDEASYLYPFWQNYPPDDRGRQPVGDQYPWIEVGEHAIGDDIYKVLSKSFSSIRSIGLPTGPDERFVVSSDKIRELTGGITDSCWVMIDIKSAGPRDNFEHAVMSHNQISGSGNWDKAESGIQNRIMKAVGKKASHDFFSSLSPIYVLSDGTILPVIIFALKPVYGMPRLKNKNDSGQPLDKIEIACIPNGILLEENPGYLSQYPGLLYPGKDDKGKNPKKIRARVDFLLLRKIGAWRVKTIQ